MNAVAARTRSPSESRRSFRREVHKLVEETLAPLRQILAGVALLRELSPRTTDLLLSFGEGAAWRRFFSC